MAAGISEGQEIRDISANHRIVKFCASHFKRIRHGTAKNRNSPSDGTTRRNAYGTTRRNAWRQARPDMPIERQRRRCREPARGCCGGCCRVRHAPAQAACRSRIPDTPKRAENRDKIKKWLTCIVFVPWSRVHNETLHHAPGPVAEKLCMIRHCAAIAETEGTCPGDARANV
jgi:hypothetical protein